MNDREGSDGKTGAQLWSELKAKRAARARDVIKCVEALVKAIAAYKGVRSDISSWLWRAMETTLEAVDYLSLRLETEENFTLTQTRKKSARKK